MAIKNRKYTCHFSLVDDDGKYVMVCRSFFFKCIQISQSRLYKALSTASSNQSGRDRRGKDPSVNKTTEGQKMLVKNFIDQIPKYESHYGRKDSQRMYLNHSLNLSSLHREYVRV